MQHARTRVAYVLPSYDAATGSHFAHLYELLARAAAELDILVLAERASGAPAGAPFRFRPQRFAFPPLRFGELVIMLLRERLAGARFAYVHYSFFGGLAAWLVFGLTGGRAYYWNCGMPWLYRRGRIEEAIFRFVLRHTILVTGTAGIAQEYRCRYGVRPECIRVLPNWINVERFRSMANPHTIGLRSIFPGVGVNRAEAKRALGIPDEAKVVLFVHRLSRRKGAHLLPGIISGVLEHEKRAMFLIVGDGPEYESVKRKVKSAKLESRVRLEGEVAHRDVPKYFAAADVFLMPSEEEGFPHVLLEAMAAGLPYVATDVGGVREITPPALQTFVSVHPDAAVLSQRLLVLLRKSPLEIALIADEEEKHVGQYDLSKVRGTFEMLFRL